MPRSRLTLAIALGAFTLFAGGYALYAFQEPPKTEFAMQPGDSVTATTAEGEITIKATSELGRTYTWAGASRSVEMLRRHERWYGSLGLYYPGPGDHWEPHDGITRAVVEEGQQHFDSEDAFHQYLRDQKQWGLTYVYNDTGIVVGWKRFRESRKLNAEVWRVFINGAAPTKLAGSSNESIKYTAAVPTTSPARE